MDSLQEHHPTLYQRVRDLAFVKLAVGVALIFSPPVPTPTINRTNLAVIASLKLWGGVFVFLGLLLIIGLYRSRDNYRLVRIALLLSVGYNLLWFLSLAMQVVFGGLASAPIFFLWAYYTRNTYHIYTDPGWETIALLRGNGTS